MRFTAHLHISNHFIIYIEISCLLMFIERPFPDCKISSTCHMVSFSVRRVGSLQGDAYVLAGVSVLLTGEEERQVYRGADPCLPALITLHPLPCTLHSATQHLPPSTPLSLSTQRHPVSIFAQHPVPTTPLSLSPVKPSGTYLLAPSFHHLLPVFIPTALLPPFHSVVSPSVPPPSNV